MWYISQVQLVQKLILKGQTDVRSFHSFGWWAVIEDIAFEDHSPSDIISQRHNLLLYYQSWLPGGLMGRWWSRLSSSSTCMCWCLCRWLDWMLRNPIRRNVLIVNICVLVSLCICVVNSWLNNEGTCDACSRYIISTRSKELPTCYVNRWFLVHKAVNHQGHFHHQLCLSS